MSVFCASKNYLSSHSDSYSIPGDSNSESEERLLKMKTMNSVEQTDKKTTTVVWPPSTEPIKSESGVLLSNSLQMPSWSSSEGVEAWSTGSCPHSISTRLFQPSPSTSKSALSPIPSSSLSAHSAGFNGNTSIVSLYPSPSSSRSEVRLLAQPAWISSGIPSPSVSTDADGS